MAVSQNGYPANDRTQCTTFVVSDADPGRKMLLRKGSPGELLAHMVRWFDKNVRDIDPGIMDDWSFAERPIRGSTDVLSNHASGTAVDVDATKWPLGVLPEAYLTAAEIAKVRTQLQRYEGCIRWGGDYTGRKDPMHFEINRDEATCNRVWAKLQATEVPDMLPHESAQLAAIATAVGRLEVAIRDSRTGLVPKVAALDAKVAALQASVDAAVAAKPVGAANVDELTVAVVDQLRAELND